MDGPPEAPRRPTELKAHGDTRVDDWYWLRDRDDPEVIAYLEAENAWTEQATAPTKALQDKLFEEIKGRIQETDASALSSPSDEQVYLDDNVLAEGHDYFSLGAAELSPDQTRLAYSTDTE